MGFFNKYPYSDYHELNLDWILKKINEFQQNLDDLEERVTEAAIAAAREYVDEEIAKVYQDFNVLSEQVGELTVLFNQKTEEIETQFDAFTTSVQEQIVLLNNRMNTFEQRVQDEITGINATIDIKIENNNEYILSHLEDELAKIKVINYFTGEKVTVQAMFNYLSELHLENPITYTELANAEITYTDFAALNMTYTELAVKGNSFINP